MNIQKIGKIGIITLFVMEVIKVVALLGIWYEIYLSNCIMFAVK